jgi:hypothetical protein
MEKFKLIVDENGKIEIWMDGCVVRGVRSIEFYWEVGEPPYHKLEFISQAARLERKYSMD